MANSRNDFSSIFGGTNNRICGVSNMIGGGNTNLIGSLAPGEPHTDHSFIGGGRENWIDSTGAATTFGSIGGGQNNYIAPGTNHASIFGGNNNSVADSCSSILGGTGNVIPAGFANSHIVGSGITLGAGVGNAGSLHVNGLWANGIQFNPLGANPGTVFALAPGALPLFPLSINGGVLWIA